MELKDFILNKTAEQHPELSAFIDSCGLLYIESDKKVVLTGPGQPYSGLSHHANLMIDLINEWSVTEGKEVNLLKVSPAAGDEIDFADYVARADADVIAVSDDVTHHDAQTLNPQATGSFIEGMQDDAGSQLAGDGSPLETQETLISTSEHAELSNELNGFPVSSVTTNAINQQKQEDEQAEFGAGGYQQEGSGISQLLRGVGSLFSKPITVPAKLISEQSKKLTDWRINRPNNAIKNADEVSAKLIQNLDAFKTDEYVSLEAKVKARGGWDFELSQEFETYLNQNNRRDQWKLINEQFKSFAYHAKKSLNLNPDQAEEIMKSLDDRASIISEKAGNIPAKISKGTVTQTVYQMSEQLREQIRLLVQKIVGLIFGKSPSNA